MDQKTAFDIAISGAGPVGLTAALVLAKAGFRIALIAPNTAPSDRRTVALLDASWRLLGSLGVSGRLADKASPLTIMRLIDDTGTLFRTPLVEFRASEAGLEAFGWNVSLTELVAALENELSSQPEVTRIEGKTIATHQRNEHIVLECDTGCRVSAKIAIAADGKNSVFRSAAGIITQEWSYPQVALTAVLNHPRRSHNDTSTEFHTRQGPCTLVPLEGSRSSLVWMVSPNEARRLGDLDDAGFALEVEKRTHSILGAFAVEGLRGEIAMMGLSVDRYAADRIMLVGETAHVFPPIGAQGLNLGLRDVQAVADVLGMSIQNTADIGSVATLERYDQQRRRDVEFRTFAVDGLNRSLLTSFMPLDFARGLVLLSLAHIGPLRRLVMRAGLAGGNLSSAGSI
jgi:2-octaprenyl-6-methoxyphenol hydroxylase